MIVLIHIVSPHHLELRSLANWHRRGERGASDIPIADLSFRNAGFRRALYIGMTLAQPLYHSNLALLYSPGRVDRR